jgi:hypothetical protein
VLHKERLAARLVTHLNWRRAPSADGASRADDDDADAAEKDVAATRVPIALTALDVFIGDVRLVLPIEQVRLVATVLRSLASSSSTPTSTTTPSLPSVEPSALMRMHLRFFVKHAEALVDMSQARAVADDVNSLMFEVRLANDLYLCADIDVVASWLSRTCVECSWVRECT